MKSQLQLLYYTLALEMAHCVDPHVRHILTWKIIPSSADSRRASCQLLVKELALNTGKLPLGGLPRNSVVK